ncbi:MAG: hypothetical protein KBS66_02050 [Eubacterium sp.]|nr:hypothetical protein [Candidatus Colimonas fimequi]
MTIIIMLTLVACVCYIAFEKVKVTSYLNNVASRNPLFTIGTIALLACWVMTGFVYWNDGNLGPLSCKVRVILGIIAVIAALALYVYILVFALPKGTYTDDNVQSSLATEGLYGMCRHPGFYGFTITALAISLLIGSGMGFVILMVHSLLNLIYIIMQDKYYFPVYLEGYDEYKKTVPFLAFWR